MAKKERTPVSEMSAEELRLREVKKMKNQKRKEEKREKLIECLQFVAENGDAELAAKARTLLPRSAGGTAPVGGGNRVSVRDLLLPLFPNGVGSQATEDDVWTALKMDRSSMRKKIVQNLKKSRPEDRLWISFNMSDGVYTLEAEGANPPADWLGYIPIDVDR